MAEGGGTKVRNIAGATLSDGTLQNFNIANAWVISTFGRSVLHEGTGGNSQISVGTFPTFTKWAIAAWVTPNVLSHADASTGFMIMSNDRGGWNDDVLFGLVPEGTSINTDKRFACVHQENTDQKRTIVTDTVDAVIGQTYHVVVTCDGSSLRLYVDGTLRDTTAKAGQDLNFDGAATEIGNGVQDSPNKPFGGTIEEVRFYGRTLNIGETKSLYTDPFLEFRQPSVVVKSPAAGPQIVVVGISTETDSAFAITPLRTKSVGLATETDTAFTVTPQKTYSVGLASEIDSAFGITHSRALSPGLASEVNSAFAITPLRTLAVGLAQELDSALAVTRSRTIQLGLASEVNTAFAVSRIKTKLVGLASEVDTAFALILGRTVSVGLASETDSALALTGLKEKAAGLAQEIDTALVAIAVRSLSVGLATELDTALALGRLKTFLVGLATELDTSLPLIVIELVPDKEGLGYTLLANRGHYTLPENLGHYTLVSERGHYTQREEDE